jgi:hypothetical protein
MIQTLPRKPIQAHWIALSGLLAGAGAANMHLTASRASWPQCASRLEWGRWIRPLSATDLRELPATQEAVVTASVGPVPSPHVGPRCNVRRRSDCEKGYRSPSGVLWQAVHGTWAVRSTSSDAGGAGCRRRGNCPVDGSAVAAGRQRRSVR